MIWELHNRAFSACLLVVAIPAAVFVTSECARPTTAVVEPMSEDEPPSQHPAPAAVVAPSPGLVLDAAIVRVIDGDTVVVRSSIEYQIRLLDCWAPESRTRDLEEKQRGLAAKSRMQELAPVGQLVRVLIPGRAAIADMMTLGRLLGRVWVLQDGQPVEPDVSRVMVSEGFATKQKGGK